MGKRINPTMVGAFVLGGVGLVLAAVVVFGSGNLFRKTHEFVIYFGGDINGLRVGAPVKFKGVEIGQVKRIKLRLEQDINRDNGKLRADVRIPVIIELDEEKIVSHGGTAIDLDDPHTVPNLIREGMRAQLGSDSFVTGLMYVALDIVPNTPIQMVAPPGSPLQEIPAVPNTLEQAQAVAVRIFERLDKVDFNAVFTQMTGAMKNAFGGLLHEAWEAKRSLTDGISNPHIDGWYARARSALISLSSATRIESPPAGRTTLDVSTGSTEAPGSNTSSVEKRAASETARTGLIR